MPSDSYRDNLIERLTENAEYASLLLETALEDAFQDGFVGGFLLSLEDVVEAAEKRLGDPTEEDYLRARLYHNLSDKENHTLETVIAALKEVGLTYEMKPVNTQVSV